MLPPFLATFSPSQWRVALLGIAQRTIHAKFDPKRPRKGYYNQLKTNALTVGEWIKSKRTQKNLTAGHVATKMGIARALVRSWEGGKCQPSEEQMKQLATILDSNLIEQVKASCL